MDKIKFKGKQIITGKWLYGDYRHPNKENKDAHIFPLNEWASCDAHRVNIDTVCQYIGRKDCNRRELYIGDEIEVLTNSIFSYGFIISMHEFFSRGFVCDLAHLDRCEILFRGNIYDDEDYSYKHNLIEKFERWKRNS